MPGSIRVALVNDYEIVLEGVRAFFRPYEPEIRVVETKVNAKPRRAVAVTLFDTYGEAEEMRERAHDLAADPSNGAVVVFSFSDDPALAHSLLRAGAQGFISKATPANQIVDGARAAADGKRVMLTQRSQYATVPDQLRWPGRDARLTERESELLALLPTGMTNRELGAHLYISENTIKTQLRGLFAKLDIRNRAQAVALAGAGILGEQRSWASQTDGERELLKVCSPSRRPFRRELRVAVTANGLRSAARSSWPLASVTESVADFLSSTGSRSRRLRPRNTLEMPAHNPQHVPGMGVL
jgi:DNA-binding NarL/FixJ family response regulator